MSRAERKLKKIEAKEELKRLEEEKKQQKIEKWKKDQEAWDNMDTTSKVIAGVIILVIGLGIGWYLVSSLKTSSSSQVKIEQPVKRKKEEPLANKVEAALNKLGEDMKSELASASLGGYQGNIVSIEPAIGKDSVKVNVSTYFKDPGDGIDGGQSIARKIFINICLDVPELDSLYVVNNSGLESKSIYRSQIPGCKQ